MKVTETTVMTTDKDCHSDICSDINKTSCISHGNATINENQSAGGNEEPSCFTLNTCTTRSACIEANHTQTNNMQNEWGYKHALK